MQRIKIIGTSITKEEQWQIFTSLGKAGYRVWFSKGRTPDKKTIIYINYEEVRNEQTQEPDTTGSGILGD